MSKTNTDPQAKVGEREQLRQELLRLIVKNEALRRQQKATAL